MKKKSLGFSSFVLILSLLLSVFAFAACTDDYSDSNENNENNGSSGRVLTEIEDRIIGEYKHYDSSKNLSYSFHLDGTYTGNNSTGIFKQGNDGIDSIFGHYYEIVLDSNTILRYYDFNSNSLYVGRTATYTRISTTRVLHSSERIIVGSWKSANSSKTYKFNSDGTFLHVGNSGNAYTDTFFLIDEGTNNKKGHYYVFKFTYTAMSNWYIFDTEPNIAYNQTGSKIATFL
ncbi:hypothetical protein [Pumilibacter intestinalis]|uniref:hypothetical protein n=1 Tax=Pumilibacter intestinalis TaxID=2941511 RepID=UPI002041F8C3|nr:hypothetical protein [Pumilibacter intestinalis]